MSNSAILQVIETNRSSLKNMMDITYLSDRDLIIMKKIHLFRLLLTIIAYFMIPISLFVLWASYDLGYWQVAAACPFVVLYFIYILSEQAKTVGVDMINKSVSIKERWRRDCSFSWENYQGHETYYSVKDFPEEFYIKFMDGGKVRKIKLADINPVFHKSTEANYTALLSLWECVETNMGGESFRTE